MKVILTVAGLLLIAAPAFAQNSFGAPSGIDPPNYAAEMNYAGGRGRTTQRTGTEQALRHQIESITAGQPDYDAMTVSTANQLRGQFAGIHPTPAQQWGALTSLRFRYRTPGGDVYEARFEHARVQWGIMLGAQGKITGIAFRTLS